MREAASPAPGYAIGVLNAGGNNHYGLLGDGTTVDTDAPVLVKF